MSDYQGTAQVLESVARICGIGAILLGVQGLSQWRLFRDCDLLGWCYLRERRRLTREGLSGALMNQLFVYPRTLTLFVLQIVGGMVVLLAPFDSMSMNMGLVGALVPVLLLRVRQDLIGSDGGHLMLSTNLAALLLAQVAPADEQLQITAVGFIAGQAVLGYAVSGWRKILAKSWLSARNRSAPFTHSLFATSGTIAFVSKFRLLPQLMAGTGLLILTTSPLVLFVPPDWCLVILASLLLFHLFNACWLGIPHFAVTWGACYPAIVYTNSYLRSWL